MADNDTETSSIELAAELTMAWLSNPNTKVEAGEVAQVLRQMHDAVNGLSNAPEPEAPPAQEYTPAVTVRKSLASKDHIISLIDGKPYKALRRHLSGHGLTPDDYRRRYGLKPDYPMVSESYSQVRRDMAKKIGLGRKPKVAAPLTKPTAAAKPPTAQKPAVATNPTGDTTPATARKPVASAKSAASAKPKAATKRNATSKPPAAAKPARQGRSKKAVER